MVLPVLALICSASERPGETAHQDRADGNHCEGCGLSLLRPMQWVERFKY